MPDSAKASAGKHAGHVLDVTDLKKHFGTHGLSWRQKRHVLRAVDGVSLSIGKAEALGLVGESGCGKSTLGRTIVRLTEPTSGSIRVLGEDITGMRGRALRQRRRYIQMIFQDPYSSLNPKMRVGKCIAESLRVHGIRDKQQLRERVEEVFDQVKLRSDQSNQMPHEFSGGQRQRICIARALAVRPEIIVADEPVSALDVSIQSQIINLLIDIQDAVGISFLFISHDLSVVRHFCQRVAIMYLGRIVEEANTEEIYRNPCHPYTKALLDSAPISHPSQHSRKVALQGDLPSPIAPPSGCHFRTRCPKALSRCAEEYPTLREATPGHKVACHLMDKTQ